MEQKIPGKSDISEKLDDLERLTKIFEMNVAEKTVPFDCRPKISKFFPNGSRSKKPRRLR